MNGGWYFLMYFLSFGSPQSAVVMGPYSSDEHCSEWRSREIGYWQERGLTPMGGAKFHWIETTFCWDSSQTHMTLDGKPY